MEVHPLAAVFPMMTDDELADLADDIREHGLLHPIVTDADGVLIDGRNRLRACEIAGVEPTYQQLNGHDAAAFIVSANLERRNLTSGQRAMALAMIYPDPTKLKRAGSSVAKQQDVSKARLSLARTVLSHSPALAKDVMAKRTSLDEALKTVLDEQRASASTDAKMAELRSDAPDIAALVDDERLTLEAGITELRARQRMVEEAIDAAKRAIGRLNDLPVQIAMLEKGVTLAGRDLLSDLNAATVTAVVKRLLQLVEDAA